MTARGDRYLSACLAITAVVGPLVALATALVPIFAHYWVPYTRTPSALVELSRKRSVEAVPPEMREYDLFKYLSELSDAETLHVVGNLQRGVLLVPNSDPAEVAPEFRHADLEHPSVDVQLLVAGLFIPDAYLAAARVTGNERYFGMASTYLRNWWRHDMQTWLPAGLQWNDHATAAQLLVLARYWRSAQARGGSAAQDADWVVDAVQVAAGRLLKPEAFTLRTNHGLMQSLALLHVAVTFPALPLAEQCRDVGRERIFKQVEWYLSAEGVVLEHSAGYHRFGLELLAMVLAHLRALGIQVPQDLSQRYERALEFDALLARPDNTLPPIGNTVTGGSSAAGGSATAFPRRARPAREVSLAPISGFAVWWTGLDSWPDASKLSQLVANWSNFATDAHDHEDEMSITLWASGREWIIASGYWPYGSPLLAKALMWEGANGPHRVGEVAAAPQSTAMVAHGHQGEVVAIELLRGTPTGNRIRRQIVQLGQGRWLVLDADEGRSQTAMETVWTLGAELWARRDGQDKVILSTPDNRTGQLVVLANHAGVDIDLVRGKPDSAIGWTAMTGRVEPTWSVVVRAPPGSVSGLMIDTEVVATGGASAQLDWKSGMHWDLRYVASGTQVLAGRREEVLRVTESGARGQRKVQVPLIAGDPRVRDARLAIDERYLSARKMTPRFNESHVPYRLRMAGVIAILSVLQLIPVAAWYLWSRRRRPTRGVRAAACMAVGSGWAGLSSWIAWVYFAA